MKTRKKEETPVQASALEKALTDLEDMVRKGEQDLEDRDPEGGFSTEGTPLSDGSPRGKASDPARKAMSASDMSGADDDEEDEGGSPPEDGSEEESGGEDDAPPAVSKALSKRLSRNETLSKAFNVAPALQQIAIELGAHVEDLSKGMLDNINQRDGKQEAFNARMATALTMIGNMQLAHNELLKSVLRDRGSRPRPKGLLRPGDIHEPERSVNKGFRVDGNGRSGGRTTAIECPDGLLITHVKAYFRGKTQDSIQKGIAAGQDSVKQAPGVSEMIIDLESRGWSWTAIPPEHQAQIVKSFNEGVLG